MSSTNRGKERSKFDYYVTPIDQVKLFLSHFTKKIGDYSRFQWIDPCAGGDTKNPMSYPEALKDYGVEPVTLDIREDSRAKHKGDYFRATAKGYDVVITNPPFDMALEFIEKALREVREGGYVVMLLRLNFFGSKKRYEFYKNYMPKYCYIHHKRMSFTEDGKTDSIEYAHFVWKKGDYKDYCKTYVI